MKKLAKCGIIIMLMVGLLVLAGAPQSVQATGGSSDANKESAIEDANRAISRVPKHFRFVDPFIESAIKEARSLVDTAIDDYGAARGDFSDLGRLEAAEKQRKKINAIQAARDAIDKIPPPGQITEEHRGIIEEARRLANIAIEKYGATDFDLCWRLWVLEEAEEKLPEPKPDPKPTPDPKPKPDPDPLPVTGALTIKIMIGLLLTGSGLLFFGKCRNPF